MKVLVPDVTSITDLSCHLTALYTCFWDVCAKAMLVNTSQYPVLGLHTEAYLQAVWAFSAAACELDPCCC